MGQQNMLAVRLLRENNISVDKIFPNGKVGGEEN